MSELREVAEQSSQRLASYDNELSVKEEKIKQLETELTETKKQVVSEDIVAELDKVCAGWLALQSLEAWKFGASKTPFSKVSSRLYGILD